MAAHSPAPPAHPSRGRVYEAAVERLAEARRTHSVIIGFVGLVLLARIVVFAWLTMARAAGATDDLATVRAAVTINNGIAIVLDGVLFVALILLFENMRRTEAEASRIQTFMDAVYRRGF